MVTKGNKKWDCREISTDSGSMKKAITPCYHLMNIKIILPVIDMWNGYKIKKFHWPGSDGTGLAGGPKLTKIYPRLIFFVTLHDPRIMSI